MSKKERAARLAPKRPVKSLQEAQDDLNQILRDRFCLEALPPFSVFLEGWTDVLYLTRAAELAMALLHEDLLAATDDDGTPTKIALRTVGKPEEPSRGGADLLVKFAKVIQSYVFSLRMYCVFFVFDHDVSGINASNGVCRLGFEFGVHTTTLNPSKPRVVDQFSIKHECTIEDLLSLEIQQRFFESYANRCCKVTYHNGQVTRFQWEGNSKTELQAFACASDSLEDLMGYVHLLRRIRDAFGLPKLHDIQPVTEQSIPDANFDTLQ